MFKSLLVTILSVAIQATTTSKSIKIGYRHAFFRSGTGGLADGVESRRVFGGVTVELNEFPAVCALLDRYWSARCSATIIKENWAITAAHCISRRLAYVKYNTRRPSSTDGDVTPIHYLYRHPEYAVRQTDEGQGLDVTMLHNDVGLVRTRNKMRLTFKPQEDVLTGLRRYNPLELNHKKIKVLGFGRTERTLLGEELFSVDLMLVGCERDRWYHCMCAVAGEAESRGVCSGDSGGPVLYEGVQIGVTSMGPVECAEARPPPVGVTSVFTTLRQYADVINATITDMETALRMRKISAATQTQIDALLLERVYSEMSEGHPTLLQCGCMGIFARSEMWTS
ncbi:unnamed protein product [Leptosia nina]|uniref:Peptidase S1 domain-containing protein n=1 Tax=Leptosia nina TaxID=320188 RepID=A0AAV1JGC5_9NEOP